MRQRRDSDSAKVLETPISVIPNTPVTEYKILNKSTDCASKDLEGWMCR